MLRWLDGGDDAAYGEAGWEFGLGWGAGGTSAASEELGESLVDVFAVTGGKDENGDLLVLNLADDAVILYSKPPQSG